MSKISVKVVIGSNYGDEGKGLATHYFSQKAKQENKSCVNVLYNGGPQRGHTVELINGVRHVFHHFGSGTFDGADTYFSRKFMINPMVFIQELKELVPVIKPKVEIHPDCRVITPFDMLVNQIVENSRTIRHGSCGHGIWETQKRYDDTEYSLRYYALRLLSKEKMIEYLREISQKYIPRRLLCYGIDKIPDKYRDVIDNENLIEHYVQDFFDMDKYVQSNSEISYRINNGEYDVVVFEGGQGLALDEDNEENYPNVTASKTTSQVPIIMTKYSNCNMEECDIEICYVTRSYFTRHGNGDFLTECKGNFPKDNTNVYNKFQGNIRYGNFDQVEFLSRVRRDFNISKYINPNLKSSVMITHSNYNPIVVENLRGYFDIIYESKDIYAEHILLDKSETL